MPLPAALASRLAKRGLLKVEEPKKASSDAEEEVFAEDYDDMTGPTIQPPPDIPQPQSLPDEDPDEEEEAEAEEDSPLVYETSACPNKWNPYHECTDFCKKHWGNKKFKSDENNERCRNRMLRKYPLSEGWVEVGDPSTSRYFYWNQLTDQVSWLSPLHPKATITVAQERMQELVSAAYGATLEAEASVEASASGTVDPMDVDDDMTDKDFEEIEREVMQERRQKEHQSDRGRDWPRGRDREKDEGERDRRKGRSRGREPEELDPMDPASYSDTPRGTWTTGLDRRGTAKTGADVTASGPLFQQRPYPSPGAVLRANKQLSGGDTE